MPASGTQRTGDQPEERRFACAVGADNAERLALGDLKIDAVGRDDGAERFCQPGDLEKHALATF